MGPHYELALAITRQGTLARQRLLIDCYTSGRFGDREATTKQCQEFVPPIPAHERATHDKYLEDARERIIRELPQMRSAAWNRLLVFWGAGCVFLFFIIWRFDRAGYY